MKGIFEDEAETINLSSGIFNNEMNCQYFISFGTFPSKQMLNVDNEMFVEASKATIMKLETTLLSINTPIKGGGRASSNISPLYQSQLQLLVLMDHFLNSSA